MEKDFTLCFAHVLLDMARGKLESWQGASFNPGKGANLNYMFNPFYFLEHLKKRLRFSYVYFYIYISLDVSGLFSLKTYIFIYYNIYIIYI